MTATVEVRERPILMSGAMVLATLRDVAPKTMTRRVMLPQPNLALYAPRLILSRGGVVGFRHVGDDVASGRSEWEAQGEAGPLNVFADGADSVKAGVACQYGKVGDRLWVRERWEFRGTDMNKWGRTHRTQTGVVKYDADLTERHIDTEWSNVEPWMKRRPGSRPSIHMPRWACRIVLELTAIRVERLQDISEDDATVEGAEPIVDLERVRLYNDTAPRARSGFAKLWDTLNAKRGFGWDKNPWVWVISFKRVTP